MGKGSGLVKLYFNPRMIAILFLGFSSGLPLQLSGATLQAWFTEADISLLTIGALSFVGLPYLLKFLWAPFLDRYEPFSIGRRRGWIFLLQLLLVVTLVWMAFTNPAAHVGLMITLAFCLAFFSASQDIVIDAYRTDVSHTDERGVSSAMTTLGYRLALLMAGGFALIFADQWGWRFTYILMALCLLAEALITLMIPRVDASIQAPKSLSSALRDPFMDFIRRPHWILIVIFLMFYKFNDALALALTTTFLLRKMEFSLITLGTVVKIVGVVATILGGFFAGGLLSRMSLYKALMYFGILQLVCNLNFAWLLLIGNSVPMLVFTIISDNVAGGMSSIALLAFVMSLCNKKFSATQYAIFSALVAIGRVFVGPLAAGMVDSMGWFWYFIVSFFVGIPVFIFMVYLNKLNLFDQQVEQK